MLTKKNLLTETDQTALKLDDSNYILNKGAKLYIEQSYADSVEYYHLAAVMGNVQAISNLGYCYLYGREVAADLSLAIAYFKLAAKQANVDAAYKLGDIYASEKWGVKDKELSLYYYRMAASYIICTDWDCEGIILEFKELEKYPSLCFALGREFTLEGDMYTDLDASYQFLIHAKAGYEHEILNGCSMYQKAYENVKKLMQSSQFESIREKYED